MIKHLDEGTIQAFIDGELSEEKLEAVAVHFAECERCSAALSCAEAELTEVENVFAVADSVAPCPSQRIWARVSNEIEIYETEKRRQPLKTSFRQTWLNIFSPAHLTFAGSLAAVVFGSFVGLVLLREAGNEQIAALNNSNQTIAANTAQNNSKSFAEPRFETAQKPILTENADVKSAVRTENNVSTSKNQTFIRRESSNRAFVRNDAPPRGFRVIKASSVSSNGEISRESEKIAPPEVDIIEPRERDYMQTLDALQTNIRGDQTLTRNAGVRFAVEKNVASMDSTIKNLRRAVRRNPKDEKARQMLYDSYQNKIEFLSELAEQSQVMASLR